VPALELHPDRLFPPDPTTRAIARRLHATVHGLPLISPHGHVDPTLLVDDRPFQDPATLFVTPDHYVKRLLHADGVDLGTLLGDELTEDRAREIWRLLCSRWALFRGTAVAYWLEYELAEVFGTTLRPSAATADALYDELAARLAEPQFRPRALYERFGIEVLATTDDPADDLAAHRALRDDPGWRGRVVPTFRPDRYLEPARESWVRDVDRLGEVTGCDVDTYGGYVLALESRRAYFREHGATSADHSHVDVGTEPLEPAAAERIYREARAGTVSAQDATGFRRHMLCEMARMSTEDGLVMTLHPGVRRDHHGPLAARYGADQGHDIPLRIEFTDALRPLLERFGTHPRLHLVLFTLDENTFSRELAPLAGFYPTVFVGAPWWFLDAPGAIARWRAAITDTIGFGRTSGFVDDTRAFCSIPARHDLARRLDAAHLAGLVSEHRLAEDDAHEAMLALVEQSRRVFRL
jgi:glucuronate isomerase